MKKFSKIILPLMLTVVFVCLSIVTSFAAEVLTVNGKEAAVGSEITYTFSIGDAQQKLCGIHLVVFFDQDLLSLKDVNTDNLGGGTIVNDNRSGNGRIIVTNSFINGTSGLDCKEAKDVVTVTFEVLKEGSTEITYYMPYLYDIDSVNIYDYTFTCDLAVDGQTVIENVAPPLEDVAQIQDFGDAGDFENNEAGTGSGIKPTTPEVQNTQQGSSQSAEGNDKGSGAIVPIICVSVIIVAIIVLVVVKSVTGKKSNGEQEVSEQ